MNRNAELKKKRGRYQILLAEKPGAHFWAEYYIEGYGRILCDTTVAEIADWVDTSEEDREAFRAYYASNLDPTPFVMQMDTDAPMDPLIPEDADQQYWDDACARVAGLDKHLFINPGVHRMDDFLPLMAFCRRVWPEVEWPILIEDLAATYAPDMEIPFDSVDSPG